jgi:hypothetical protein
MHQMISEEGNIARFDASEKPTQDHYDEMIPAWERVIARHGSMRLLLVPQNFEGWEPGTAWDDFRFSAGHP